MRFPPKCPSIRSFFLHAAAGLAVSASLVCLRAAPINPDNILVSIGQSLSGPTGALITSNSIKECTPTGQLLQTIPFEYRDRAYPQGEILRDIVVDQYGSLYGFNGTFNPFLTRYSSDNQSFTHKAFPGWDTLGYSTAGGIAAYGNFIFTTDMATFHGQQSGIVRFDTSANTAVRFADGTEFLDLNIGLDGNLYGIFYNSGNSNGANRINVYDPASLAFIKQIAIPASITNTSIQTIAVDAGGRIFLAGQEGTIYRINQAGGIEASKSTGYKSLTDIDIDEASRLLVGQNTGRVLMGDTSLLNDFTSFLAINDPRVTTWTFYVSFAHAVPPPPSPAPTPIPTPVPVPTPKPVHDILVSLGGGANYSSVVREFTAAGKILRTIPFNYDGGNYSGPEYLRDIVVDQNGAIDAYNGTFNPILTRYLGASDTFTHTHLAGWTNDNNVTYGGIASYRDFIYVTAMGASKGIIRFDTSTNASARVGDSIDFMDVNIGLDGKLYGLYSKFGAFNNATHINVYDPVTLALLNIVPIPSDVIVYDDPRSVAVDQLGRIFLSGWHGSIRRLDSSGTVQASGATGLSMLIDMDIDETGRLILGQVDGRVIVGDVSLENFSSFPATDAGTSYLGIFVAFAPLPSPRLLNISTRMVVGTGDKVGIGGFIVTGVTPKKVVLRAIGPSLSSFGVSNSLQDPILELHGPDGAIIAIDDDWQDSQADEIRLTGLMPSDNRESAIIRTLAPGNYTAVVRGKNTSAGIGLVELYDIDAASSSNLGNISTRAHVDVNDDVVIGGVIIGGGVQQISPTARALIRGMGPSLTQSGVPNALQDPTIELHNGNGDLIASNDDWADSAGADLQATGLAPSDPRESALLMMLPRGNYTAVLRGKGNTTGVGLIEAYNLD
jgi:hypothetical protein